ncbi:MAG TPA: hypothetical protein PL063_06695 [Candidatus Cloacimonadota bacterium]|nr:hypothetical protein [Candidatus Cloacimonadota bacterium]HQB41065.1 hypothetical protein [Candidatus Cloacimonadota bacterium]
MVKKLLLAFILIITSKVAFSITHFDGAGKLDLPKNTQILSFFQANVYDNDKSQDVYLLGEPGNGNAFANVWLYVDEGEYSNEMITYLHSDVSSCSLTSLSAVAVHQDNYQFNNEYILFSSTANTISSPKEEMVILDLRNKATKILFDTRDIMNRAANAKKEHQQLLEFNKAYYKDNYAAVIQYKNGDTMTINLKKKKKLYDNHGIYKNGRLLLIDNNEIYKDKFFFDGIKKVNKQNSKKALIFSQYPVGPTDQVSVGRITNWLMLDGNNWVIVKREHSLK